MNNLAFKCNTHFQLMNAINIKLSLYPNTPADLFLDDTTDFDDVITRLQKEKVFNDIIYIPMQQIVDTYIKASSKERINYVHNVVSFLNIEITKEYSDCFFGLDNVSNKLFYYYLIAIGQQPSIHIFEEGTTSFVRNVVSCTSGDGMPHAEFAKKSFISNISEQMFYEPSLFCGGKPVKKLTKVPKPNETVKDIYSHLYDSLALPQEKFIFFEEAFLKEKYPSNDVELLDSLADIVGIDNIIIKLHPRTVIDRFSFRGYKVMKNNSIPWEMCLLNNDISQKVLVSVFSTSTITPKYVYGMQSNVIHLNRLFVGKYPLFIYKGFYTFRKQLYDMYNTKLERNFYCPNTIEELKDMAIYFNGAIK